MNLERLISFGSLASALPSPTILIYPSLPHPLSSRPSLTFTRPSLCKMTSDPKETERLEHNAVEEVFEFYHDSGDELNTE